MSVRYSDLSNLFIVDMFIMDMCRYGAQYRDAIPVSARIAWLRQGQC
jgi:hypothetical protein